MSELREVVPLATALDVLRWGACFSAVFSLRLTGAVPQWLQKEAVARGSTMIETCLTVVNSLLIR